MNTYRHGAGGGERGGAGRGGERGGGARGGRGGERGGGAGGPVITPSGHPASPRQGGGGAKR